MEQLIDVPDVAAVPAGRTAAAQPGEAGRILIDNVTQVFAAPRSAKPLTAIRRVDIDISPGEFTAVVGPSGCGKSTLLNLISGLIVPSRGSVHVNGSPVTGVRDDIGYMPARDALLPWRTVAKNVTFPLEVRGAPAKERRTRAMELIEAVGLKGFESHYPHMLSQGMRQRVAIARTFVNRPQVLLLDEPFSALDAQTRVQIQDLFLEIWEREKHTVVLITHDVMEAVALADRVVVFTPGPGEVKAVYDIDLPRPRSVHDLLFDEPRFQDHVRQIWADLSFGSPPR